LGFLHQKPQYVAVDKGNHPINGVYIEWQGFGPGDGDHRLLSLPLFQEVAKLTARLQATRLQRTVGEAATRLDLWATNPWRRTSLLLIALTASFMIGNGVASVSGALNLMDPVAAMLSVGLMELMVRARRHWAKDRDSHLGRQLLDMTRIGLLYGLLLEGFKLL